MHVLRTDWLSDLSLKVYATLQKVHTNTSEKQKNYKFITTFENRLDARVFFVDRTFFVSWRLEYNIVRFSIGSSILKVQIDFKNFKFFSRNQVLLDEELVLRTSGRWESVLKFFIEKIQCSFSLILFIKTVCWMLEQFCWSKHSSQMATKFGTKSRF